MYAEPLDVMNVGPLYTIMHPVLICSGRTILYNNVCRAPVNNACGAVLSNNACRNVLQRSYSAYATMYVGPLYKKHVGRLSTKINAVMSCHRCTTLYNNN